MARNHPRLMEGCQHGSFSNCCLIVFCGGSSSNCDLLAQACSQKRHRYPQVHGPIRALQAPLRELELAPEVPGRTDSPVGSSWFLATRTARICPMVSKSAAVEYASHCSRGGPCGLSPMAPNDDTKRGETRPPTLRDKYCV
jgi:hypothetical protein